MLYNSFVYVRHVTQIFIKLDKYLGKQNVECARVSWDSEVILVRWADQDIFTV